MKSSHEAKNNKETDQVLMQNLSKQDEYEWYARLECLKEHAEYAIDGMIRWHVVARIIRIIGIKRLRYLSLVGRRRRCRRLLMLLL